MFLNLRFPIMRYGIKRIRFAPWPEIKPPMGPAKGQSPSATTYIRVLRTVIKEGGGGETAGCRPPDYGLGAGAGVFRTFGKSALSLCRYTAYVT